jgi:N6-L-threonylcarbamoyladenine synthase
LEPYILGIESSCDDTSAAVVHGNYLLSNIIANQDIHKAFGGVVPEYASRAHQQNIIPVVDLALHKAKINKNDLHAIAFTGGPGLMGSLLVGASFAKAFALGLGIPLISVDHLNAHILSHFIAEKNGKNIFPVFPFLCLTVSGGHTQIVKVSGPFNTEILGRTIDDAAGEAFDKAAKILGLPYPGGVLIDQYAKKGNPSAFKFSEPSIAGLDFSFSGLKTSFLYFVRDNLKIDINFIEKNRNDLCASIQFSIVNILMEKLKAAVRITSIHEVAIAGGVSANSALRSALIETGKQKGWNIYIPKIEYSTDNAAMIAVAGWFKYKQQLFAGQEVVPYTRSTDKTLPPKKIKESRRPSEK